LTTESLIVELDARTAKLDAKLSSTNEKLDELTESSEKSDSGLKKLGGAAAVAGAVILKTAAAATALAGAVTAIVLSSAKSRRELELLAKQAKTSTSDFQALSFATNRYGINAEQIADISKDIADKVGEFSAAGTGAFQDYADVMRLSKDEARAAANEFEGLSSQEILGKMVSRMEDASVSGDKMTFVLESLGNDASRLIPLFSGNSKELTDLKKRFDDVNNSLQITSNQAEALQEVSTTFTLLTSSAGNATTAISATLAPVLDDFFNDIIAIVPDATQTVIDFINSFLDAENISSISGVNKEIEKVNESIKQTTETMINQVPRMRAGSEAQLASDQLRLKELEAQLVVLNDQEKKLEDVNRLSGGQIGGEVAEVTDTGLGTGDEIQAIEDRFKLEETLLAEKLVRELQIIGDNNELKLELEKEFAENIDEIRSEAKEKQDEARQEELEAAKELLDDRAKLDLKAGKAKIKLEDSVAQNAVGLLKMIGGENKAAALIALGIQKATALSANATATLSGSLLAYASQLIPGDPTSVIRAEAARDYTLGLGAVNAGLIVATGLGQAVGIAKGGGGGGANIGGGGGTVEQADRPVNDFNDQGTIISDISDGGITRQSLVIEFNDEVVDALSRQIQKSQSDGRT
jgi:hypothetical protein